MFHDTIKAALDVQQGATSVVLRGGNEDSGAWYYQRLASDTRHHHLCSLQSVQMRERWQEAALSVLVIILVLGFGQVDDGKEGFHDLRIELCSGVTL